MVFEWAWLPDVLFKIDVVLIVRVGVGWGGVVPSILGFCLRYGTTCTVPVHTLVPLYTMGWIRWFRSGSEGGSEIVGGSEWFRPLWLGLVQGVWSGLFATLDGSSDG